MPGLFFTFKIKTMDHKDSELGYAKNYFDAFVIEITIFG